MTALALSPNLAHRAKRHQARAAAGTERGSAPVRRRSPGEVDADRHCRPMPLSQRRELVRILDAYNEAHRGPKGIAPMTPSALRVLRTMAFQLMDWTTGVLDPALLYIAQVARRSYETVNAAKRQLERLGVLKIQRRSRRGDDPDGPKWVQDTNLYRLELPERVARWWEAEQRRRKDRARGRAPDDAQHHLEAREREVAEHEAAETAEQRHARMAAELMERRRRTTTVQGPGAARFHAENTQRIHSLEQELGLLPTPESKS